MTDEELKRELYNFISKQCSAVSVNMEHRLVYHYDQMEKVGEFIYNLEEKRISELQKENAELKEQLKNNPYVQLLQKEKSEMAEDFVKQIEKLKTCRNCNKEFTESCETCKRGFYDGEFDKWELAE